jgi:hypothetical protein
LSINPISPALNNMSSSDLLRKAKGLSFNGKFDILLEMRLGGVTKQVNAMAYGQSQFIMLA